MTRRKEQSHGLFDPPPEPRREPPPRPPSPDACPRCGREAQRSVRPREYGDRTHYCSACPGDEPGEPFRFTPGEGPKSEGKAKEPPTGEVLAGGSEALKPLTTLTTGYQGDPPAPDVVSSQLALLDPGRWWEEYWRGMPEFEQRDLTPWHSVAVSFRSSEAVEEFERLVGQTVPNYSKRTPHIWYPEAEIGVFKDKRYRSRTPRTPRFPVYIISKGRWETSLTSRHLAKLGVPHNVVVEEPERDRYVRALDPRFATVLTLDTEYQRRYDPCDDLGETKSKGPGPARNFAWEHSAAGSAEWHWVMDDNIDGFYRLNRNLKTPVADGTIFYVMEEFVLLYPNVAMAGPNYFMFASRKCVIPPFVRNTRIYSCNLIRNDLPFRWRGRYNEDTDLSLRILKAGMATVQFNAFLQFKVTTQTLGGGCTAEFYAKEGTRPKSEMQVRLHPDVSRLVERWGRTHHYVDYSPFERNPFGDPLRVLDGPDEFGMYLEVDEP